jgi:hypothetical protein
MLITLPPFIIAGWLMDHAWRGGVVPLIKIVVLAVTLYVSGFVILKHSINKGGQHFWRVKVKPIIRLKQVFSIKGFVVPWHLHSTVVTVISGVRPLGSAMNIATALYAIYGAVRYLSDPDGLQYSLDILQAIYGRNSVIEMTLSIMSCDHPHARLTWGQV